MDETQRRATLTASIKDGSAYSLMQGVGERNVQPYAAFLGAPEAAFGLLVALSAFAGGLFQVLGANRVDASGRRQQAMIAGAVVQALSWAVAIAALALDRPWSIGVLIVSQVTYLGAVHFTIPPWSSAMGDVVPIGMRGRYFGVRNFWCGAAHTLAFTAAAVYLDQLKPAGLLARGFLALFVAALLFRLLSTYYLTRMHVPPYAVGAGDRFTVAQFVRRAPSGNFGRFVFYAAALHLGVMIAGPFLGYYMLRDLGFSYTEYMIANNLQLIGLFATQPLWGRIADRWGNKRLLAVGGIGIGLIPVLWLLGSGRPWIYAAMVFDGTVWAAFQLAALNYLYDVVTPPKRARCMAYYNLFVGLGLALGSLLGGALYLLLPPHAVVAGVDLAHPFLLLACVSAVGRLAPSAFLLPTFGEQRVRARVAENPARAGGAVNPRTAVPGPVRDP